MQVDSPELAGAACGELGGRLGAGRVLDGPLAWELGQGALDLAPDSTDGDAEDALPTLEEVDDLVVAGALVDRGAVAHQSHPGQVVGAAGAEVLHGRADLLQGDAGVVARGRPAVAGVTGQRRDVVGEEQTLLLRRRGRTDRLGLVGRALRPALLGVGHCDLRGGLLACSDSRGTVRHEPHRWSYIEDSSR